MKCLSRTTILALAALSLPLSACQTDDLKGNVLMASRLVDGTPPPSGLGAWLHIYLSRDDCGLEPTNCPWQRVRVDGQFVVWADTVEYMRVYASGMLGFVLPPGNHVYEIVADDGTVLAQTPALETKADMLQHLVVFGDAAPLHQKWLVDDPTQLAPGVVRARLVNALSSHDPIQPVRCSTPNDPCTQLSSTPLAYGGVFETDLPAGSAVQELGWKWAAPGAVDPVFNPLGLRFSETPPTSYGLRIPTRVGSEGCPSCIRASF